MKKIKMLITLLISIVFIIIFAGNNIVFAANEYQYVPERYVEQFKNNPSSTIGNGFSSEGGTEFTNMLNQFKEDDLGAGAIGKYLVLGNIQLENADNLYCIEHYKQLPISIFKVVNYIEIEGTVATNAATGATTDDVSNLIMAELLASGEQRYGSYENYADTQQALYLYMKTWLDTVPSGQSQSNRNALGLPSNLVTGSNSGSAINAGATMVNEIKNEVMAAYNSGSIDSYKTKAKLYFLESSSTRQPQRLLIAFAEKQTDTQLIIEKVDSETGEPLANVGFVINNSKGEYLYQNTSTGEIEYVDQSQATTFKTDGSGMIVITGLEADTYTITETVNPDPKYAANVGKTWSVQVEENKNNKVKLENTPEEEEEEEGNSGGNVKISGTVWEEEFDGKSNQFNDTKDGGDKGVEGVKVYWKSGDTVLATTTTDSNGYYEMFYELTIEDHVYRILKADWNLINDSYVEFEYNGLKYITVADGDQLADNTSKAIEQEDTRTQLDGKFNEVTPGLLKNGDIELTYESTEEHKSELLQIIDNTADYSDFAVKADTEDVVSDLMKEHAQVTKNQMYCVHHCFKTEGDMPYDVNDYYKDYKGTQLTLDNGVIDIGKDHNVEHEMSTECEPHEETGYHLDCWDLQGNSHCVEIDENYLANLPCEFEIPNINLGLVRKEQPDIALTSDINKVRVIMKNQEYTYYYNGRGLTEPSDDLFDYTVKFSGKYTNEYRRPVNPADVSYVNYHNTEDLQVYVTYDIIVKNQSTTLPVEVGEIVNYYDANYTFNSGTGTWEETSKYGDSYNSNGYKAMYTQQLAGVRLEPGMASEKIQIEYRVNDDVVKSLLSVDEALLKNVSEIYIYKSYYGGETMCSEHKTADERGWTGNQYAGIDADSAPGSATPGDDTTYEDDTDNAPTFVLCKDPNYKIISGLVWEDANTRDGSNERVGNGQYDSGENLIEGAQIQLLRINENGETEPAYLYYIDNATAKRSLAVTYSDAGGNYSLGQDTVSGVVVDNYVVKYTYGNGQTTLMDFDNNGGQPYTVELKTKINDANGSPIAGDEGNPENIINARNYKSTIIAASPLIEVMKGSGFSIEPDEWHLNHTDNYSVAVDDLEERMTIPSLTYGTFDTPVTMSAYTAPFRVQVEYSTIEQDSTQKQEGNGDILGEEFVGEGEITSGNLTSGTDYENEWTLFDFGIIERAREDIVVDKTIENIKITLANGQVLTEGDPYGENALNYIKALGDSAIGENAREDAADANAKFLFIEIDAESIQGARLDILYRITVTNNSELDYEYEYDYSNIEANSNIVKDNRAYYYYFGEITTPVIKSTVEWLADYMDPEVTCTVGPNNIAIEDVNGVNDNTYIYQENKDASGQEKIIWMQVTPEVDAEGNRTKTAAERLFNADGGLTLDANIDGTNETFISDYQLLSEAARDKIEDENYTIFLTNYFYDVVSGTTKTLNLFASKLIPNQAEEYTYENHVEILQLNGKIARTIDSVDGGQQVDKLYKPGDYIPSLDRNGTVEWLNYREGFHELDDDMITIRITPPTGLGSNAIIYISVGAVALIVFAVGIFFIKRKVLDR